MDSNQLPSGLEIAIIGIGCRFPGARNWKEYWSNLVNGVESVRFLSSLELTGLGVDEEKIDDPAFVSAVAELEGKEHFDSSFFNYRPDDAGMLNPAHRIFHECVWEALEDAGCDPDRTRGLIGLYAGAGEDLNWKIYSNLKNIDQRTDGFTLGQINNKDYLASLLSYKLNLKGPAYSVNTACSTSLVAIHLACKSLLLGEASMALAGGVSVQTSKQRGYTFQEGMILSSDGHCRAFDKDASGTINSEGAGVVVLKRLKNALADGDNIYGIIKGSAINNDGNRKVGFTAPSVEGQAECIKMAHKFSKVSPEGISYIEAHGTGTRLGDPIEVEALNSAFHKKSEKYCAVGSVKANLGHLDAAAGVAGLIKTALMLKYKKMPATLHFRMPNPEIDFDGGPFYVNAELRDWSRKDHQPLRAGVSSFGIGGTNCHIVMEEAPERKALAAGREYQLLTLTARTEGALRRYASDLRGWLEKDPAIDPADMAYTLQTGRKHFEYRRSIVYRHREELLSLLGGEQMEKSGRKIKDQARPIVFLFPGQGSQYSGMCRGLYEEELVFREVMDHGFSVIKQLTGVDLKAVLFPEKENDDRLRETRYTQPVIFIVEYSLSRLTMSWGINPQYMLGHSIGEYVAACISGVFSYEDALRLISLRGELMNSMPEGSMLSVAIGQAQIRQYLGADISLAAVNGPEQVVLSGDPRSIAELARRLEKLEIPLVPLHTSHAFHSGMMDPITGDFRKALQNITLSEPSIPFVSNLTGTFIRDDQAKDPEYWVRQLRETVQFSDSVGVLLRQEKEMVFVEVGAGHSLIRLVKQQSGLSAHLLINLVRHYNEKENDQEYLTERIGRLWCSGVAIDWAGYHISGKRNKIPMPTYSFEKTFYPAEVDLMEAGVIPDIDQISPTKGLGLKDWIYYPIWKSKSLEVACSGLSKRRYLYFSSGTDLSCLHRESEGSELVEVLAGGTYRRESKYKYVIDPSHLRDYATLLEQIVTDGIELSDIVYGWGMGADPASVDLLEDSRDLGLLYFGMVNVIKSLLAIKSLTGKRFVLLTDRLYDVTGDEILSVTPSLLAGLMNVLPQEYSVACCHVDIDRSQLPERSNSLLSNEIMYNLQDRIVAIRWGKRWVQDYQRNTQTLTGKKNLLQKEGLYLITGGEGKIGAMLANYLVDHYQAKVVTIGRKKRAKADRSGNIIYYSADITRKEELQEVVDEVERDLGRIAGVIHAAGITDRDYFELTEDISFRNSIALFAPKIKGIENIYAVFKDRMPDFVWATSSLSALLGGLGFGSYAAANLYMDHFISSKANELAGWKSVRIGEILFSPENIRQERASNRTALKPEEICALFEWSLSATDNPVIIETTVNLFSRLTKAYVDKKERRLDSDLSSVVNEKAERPELKTAYVKPETETEKIVVGMLDDFFGITGIGVEDDFFELGGDSLKATIFLKRLEQAFKIKFLLADFYSAKTIRQVADDIDEKIWINKSSKKESHQLFNPAV